MTFHQQQTLQTPKYQHYNMKAQLKQHVANMYPQLVTLNKDGIPVSLTGTEVVRTIAATANAPEKVAKVRPATEAEMMWLYNSGNPFLELVNEVEKTEKKQVINEQ